MPDPRADGEAVPGAAELYLRLAPAVLGYLRAQHAPEPEDLLGEVFLQVARDLPRFDGDDDAVRRWVFTIAHHRLVDDGRRRRARPRLAGFEPADAPDPATVDGPGSPDPALRAALGSLTAEQREVVGLRFVADLSLEDVAAVTGRSVHAVKALQQRALANLRRTISQPA